MAVKVNYETFFAFVSFLFYIFDYVDYLDGWTINMLKRLEKLFDILTYIAGISLATGFIVIIGLITTILIVCLIKLI